MCSVADRLTLAYPTNGGPIKVLVNVQLSNSKKMPVHKFDCDQTIGELDRILWLEPTGRQEVGKFMKWDQHSILPFSLCADKECFDTEKYELPNMIDYHHANNPAKPWNELDKQCSSKLDWPVGCEPGHGTENPELHCSPNASG
jgi:hypothetical protein